MASNKSVVRVTPLMGGTKGGACSLLEIGDTKILLDCGNCIGNSFSSISGISEELKKLGGLDAILISHADFHHMGSLGIIAASLEFPVPIFCTLPVYKFGQIMLYDYYLNRHMENTQNAKLYVLDDLDDVFSNVQTLKFNQTMLLQNLRSRTLHDVSICCYPSGRTIGGSMWRIRCGAIDILYIMDVNLKKEMVLDGATLDRLPAAPMLLISDAGGSYASAVSSSTGGSAGRKKKDDDIAGLMFTSAVETLRSGGNVLVPCETAGRALELLQLFSKHWSDNSRFGMYHLIFLSHMAHNVPEFARMQLEWMGDSLSRGFYNGRPNPFELPNVKVATSIKEVERKYAGPKVVFATDSSLSCGLSKELLLKWGGDPKNRVMFVDASDPGSLAAEIRKMLSSPPIVVTVEKPTLVELVGEELTAYQQAAEEKLRLSNDSMQRKRRQDELSQVSL
jgi:cleavage and polyadenylation specificity factor subunit 2